jgi:ubiquinone/menaquinone biosynthesis C-methylase UbiE
MMLNTVDETRQRSAGTWTKAQALKQKERHDYDAVAKYYDSNTTPLTDVFGKHALNLLDVNPGDRVLEVACGTGTLLPEVAGLVGPRGTVTGVDQSAEMLAIARRRVIDHQLDTVDLIQGDAEDLEHVPLSTYDRALSVFGFMYFPNPLTALRRLRAVLKPGGRVAICVWGMPEAVPGLTLPMEAGARVLFPPPISWLVRTGVARKMLYRQLLKEKFGGGKSPMCLAPEGLLEGMMVEVGFTNLKREEPSHTFTYQSFDEYWGVLMGTPARLLVQQYADAKVARTKAVIAQLLRERCSTDDGRLGIPMSAVIVVGEA